jgi:hypothetical protein
VTLVNFNGMALFGPGSEWFWTMLQFLALAITFYAIYRQLRVARGANAFEHLASIERDWATERNIRFRLDVLVALRDGHDPADVADGAVTSIADLWNRVGTLTRKGHIDRVALYHAQTPTVQTWWTTLGPTVRKWRAEEGIQYFKDFEWLAAAMVALDRHSGVPETPLDAADATYWQPQWRQMIHTNEALLRTELALRTVIVASPDAMSAGQPTATPSEAPTES